MMTKEFNVRLSRTVPLVFLVFVLQASVPISDPNISLRTKEGGVKSGKPENRLSVLGFDGSALLNDFLMDLANNQLDARSHNVSEALKSKKGAEEYIESVQGKYASLFNHRRERTPLNAVVTKIMEMPGYRIESVVYESIPNHHVTGNLYVPSGSKGPGPGVLIAVGHARNGKASKTYQSMAALLVNNGFVVFMIDTYGQGEMLQVRDSSGLKALGPTVSHTQLDIGAMLVGSDIVFHQMWNNIRAIDYLTTRPEVDEHRIAVTGNSGGGTQTLFLPRADSRIKAAAPSCALQTRRRMFSLNGPADGCHHVFAEGEKMMEYADYLTLAFPTPILVLAGEQDNLFDVNAVSRTVREAKWFYKTLGHMDRLDLFTVDDVHGYHKGLREEATWWFKKWLFLEEGAIAESDLVLLEDADLQATKSGQVLMEFPNSKSLVNIHVDMAMSYQTQREQLWRDRQTGLQKVKELIGYQEKGKDSGINYEVRGRLDEGDYSILKILITSRDGFPLPALLIKPNHPDHSLPATVYISSDGKQTFFESAERVSEAVKRGRTVLCIDLRGFGETRDKPGSLRMEWTKWNKEHRIAQTALHIGKPLIGQRVQDVIDAVDFLCHKGDLQFSGIEIASCLKSNLIALHAAALDSRLLIKRRSKDKVSTWMDIIKAPLSKDNLSNVVPRALEFYDLPDLIAVH